MKQTTGEKARYIVAMHEALGPLQQILGAHPSALVVIYRGGKCYAGNMSPLYDDGNPNVVVLKAYPVGKNVARELKKLKPDVAEFNALSGVIVEDFNVLAVDGDSLRELTEHEIQYQMKR
ncbi:MAG: hypothetical protein HYY37_06955 [Candidatus Aenigmarchaeota archaeon]|nr:hypothetical protein [Candidatus Aenigmarchaeota archaeon]